MNKVILLGRLVRDPDVKYTQNGKCVTQITIAVNRPYQKDKQQEADFIPVIFWGKSAETVGNHFAKGERILVTGRLQIRSYDAKDGSKRWVTEVIATDFPEFIEKKQSNGKSEFEEFGTPFDEEIPF
jgi:single-strand DNA-binding protein